MKKPDVVVMKKSFLRNVFDFLQINLCLRQPFLQNLMSCWNLIRNWNRVLEFSNLKFIGGSRGGVPGALPQGSRFFHFDIQNLRNVTASGVHAPYEVHAPLREILDPPLKFIALCLCHFMLHFKIIFDQNL